MFKAFLKPIFRLFSTDIALDLGTANTRLFKKNEGIVANDKTAIAIKYGKPPLESSEKVVAIGQNAIDLEKEELKNIKIFAPIKNSLVSNRYAEALIENFFKIANNLSLAAPRVVVSIPYGSTEVERLYIREAIFQAGAREVFLIEKPMATAIGAKLPVKEPVKSMIVDIGAGTTDIAIISNGGIDCAKSIIIAGDEIDKSIIKYIKNKFNIVINKKEAEKLKIELGSAVKPYEELSLKLPYHDMATNSLKYITVTSTDIYNAMQSSLQSIVDNILDILNCLMLDKQEEKMLNKIGSIKKSNTESVEDIKKNGITISGGGSLIRGIDKYIYEKTKIPINLSKNPFLDNIHGVAEVLDILDKLHLRNEDD